MALHQSLIKECRDILDELEQKLPDIRERLAKAYPNPDAAPLGIPDWTATRLMVAAERMIRQMRAALASDAACDLPHVLTWDVFGRGLENRQLKASIANVRQHLVSGAWGEAANWVEVCIGYLVIVGFWNTPVPPTAPPDAKIAELVSEFELKAASLSGLVKQTELLRTEFDKQLAERRQEAERVKQVLNETTTNGAQVSKLLQEATGKSGQLNEVVKQQEAARDKAKAELEYLEKKKAETDAALKNTLEQLAAAKTTAEWIEKQRVIVNELAGTSAAGVLGEKFEARKKQLQESVSTWLKALWAAVGVSMVWVAYAKMTFSISSQDIWVLLASNFGILLPPAFLLTFVSVHYGRERQFQEEYAFRSAIAMTLSAFAERLGTDEAAKKELIKNTVERLYQTPLLLSEKPKSASPLQLHAARSLVNGLKELVTEAKK